MQQTSNLDPVTSYIYWAEKANRDTDVGWLIYADMHFD